MQTFLPFPSYAESAQCLDNQRLGKQITECWQIYQTLTGESEGYKNHPAVKMWGNNLRSLLYYGIACYGEWKRRLLAGERGGVMEHKSSEQIVSSFGQFEWINLDAPKWVGDLEFHSRHRAILLGKNYEWYSRFGWGEQPAGKVNGRWPYLWPVLDDSEKGYHMRENVLA